MKKVLFFPNPKYFTQNPYCVNTYLILRELADYFTEPFAGVFKSYISVIKSGRYDYVVLNWLDAGLVDRSEGKIKFKLFVLFFLKLLFFKSISKNILYVRHNHYPHGLKREYYGAFDAIFSLIEFLSSRIVVLNNFKNSKNYIKISHPRYKVSFPVISNKVVSDDIQERYVLAFGSIDKYKGYIELVDNWDFSIQLVIVGKASDYQFLSELVGLSKNKNILIINKFISENELQSLVCNSSFVILMHEEKHQILSGSLVYALSFPVPVLAYIRSSNSDSPLTLENSNLHRFYNFSDLRALLSGESFVDFNDIWLSDEIVRREWLCLFNNTSSDTDVR